MNDLWEAISGLGDQLAAHVLLSAAAIALGIVVALPLAVWASRSPAVARGALAFASLVQTIPALALLALFFPILLSLRAVFGEGLPTLGFLPALLALALYALLPILRNAVTAQANLDPGVIEAARGVGMSFRQRLLLVEAPLSAPYIMAGIRTAAVWTIGAATLATTIGQKSLGDPIFAGLQTQNWVLVLAGCFASAGLALLADTLLGTIERGFRERKRGLWLGGMAAVLLGVGTALFAQFGGEDEDTVVIGAKGFSEQYILARLIGQRLEAEGFAVEYRDGLGSAIAHSAAASGDVDVYVDYTGTIWTNQMKRMENPSREEMYDEIVRWEDENTGMRVLGRLGFENAYGLAVRAETFHMTGVETIDDLARVASQMTVGGDPEFFERPEWIAVRDAYGLRFAGQRNFSPTFMYNALQSGEADVIGAYTSDGRIVADNLVILDDPRGAFPNYDAVLLLSPQASADAALVSALEPLIDAIDVGAMREANYSVDREDDKLSFDDAARKLADQIGL
ncbi:ABC transporter permease/substrate-binding protein [Qipengyuania psychrotolerans]|uniref:ABC transporter permease/substrate-binding protein n=1 Tax=Qipengyuania psychrotolerans TaxID=2867238 RepID=A0ABX8ZCT7_9SPHN|nr:ABC transporter permease/substrate-binding protein [Qipengyuania psychrotolerans]QZD86811.1 ABC transporter permease/substrate-binding protein [Qipengyuania psychrotolerans]